MCLHWHDLFSGLEVWRLPSCCCFKLNLSFLAWPHDLGKGCLTWLAAVSEKKVCSAVSERLQLQNHNELVYSFKLITFKFNSSIIMIVNGNTHVNHMWMWEDHHWGATSFRAPLFMSILGIKFRFPGLRSNCLCLLGHLASHWKCFNSYYLLTLE